MEGRTDRYIHFRKEVLLIGRQCFDALAKAVNNCFHDSVIAAECYMGRFSVIHHEHLIAVRFNIVIFRPWMVWEHGFLRLIHAIHAEFYYLAMTL